LSLPFKTSNRNFVGYEEFSLLGYERRAVLHITDISEECTASIFRVEEYAERYLFCLLVRIIIWHWELRQSVQIYQTTRRHIPEDSMPCSSWSPPCKRQTSHGSVQLWSPSRPVHCSHRLSHVPGRWQQSSWRNCKATRPQDTKRLSPLPAPLRCPKWIQNRGALNDRNVTTRSSRFQHKTRYSSSAFGLILPLRFELMNAHLWQSHINTVQRIPTSPPHSTHLRRK
jgi:hypothetical protein